MGAGNQLCLAVIGELSCVACATCQHDAPDGLMLAKAMRAGLPRAQYVVLRSLRWRGVADCWRTSHTSRLPQAMTCKSGANLPYQDQ